MLVSWKIIASLSGEMAAAVATVEVFVGSHTQLMQGAVALQQSGNTTLCRIAVLNDDNRNIATICLPSDASWKVLKPRKVKTKNVKAWEVVVELREDSPEGYEKLKITLPYDGDNGSSATFAHSLVFACAHVFEEISAASREAAKAKV